MCLVCSIQTLARRPAPGSVGDATVFTSVRRGSRWLSWKATLQWVAGNPDGLETRNVQMRKYDDI